MAGRNNQKYLLEAQDLKRVQTQQEVAMIDKLLDIITIGIIENGGLIHFGNTNLFLKDGVPYECTNWKPYTELTDEQKNKAVKLYSDDGWSTLEDIANWADIVKDYSDTKKLGDDAMREKGYLPKEEKPKTLSKEEILGAIRELSYSQGFYGRLLQDIYESPEILDNFESLGFTTTLDLILYIEG